jgi:hypothetical protein
MEWGAPGRGDCHGQFASGVLQGIFFICISSIQLKGLCIIVKSFAGVFVTRSYHFIE